MTIKAIKEKYKDYQRQTNEKNMFTTYDYQNGDGKIVIVVNSHPNKYIGKYVTMAIRVSDGKELIPRDSCRPCDNMEDAIDVAGEMMEVC